MPHHGTVFDICLASKAVFRAVLEAATPKIQAWGGNKYNQSVNQIKIPVGMLFRDSLDPNDTW